LFERKDRAKARTNEQINQWALGRGKSFGKQEGQVEKNSLTIGRICNIDFHAIICVRARSKEKETKNCIEDAVEVWRRNKYYTINPKKLMQPPSSLKRKEKERKEKTGSFLSFFVLVLSNSQEK